MMNNYFNKCLFLFLYVHTKIYFRSKLDMNDNANELKNHVNCRNIKSICKRKKTACKVTKVLKKKLYFTMHSSTSKNRTIKTIHIRQFAPHIFTMKTSSECKVRTHLELVR